MSDEIHMLPWEIDTVDAMRDHGLPEGEARDLVILDWLSRGDTKPFYDFILCGHQPSRRVLQALAIMLMRGDSEYEFDPARTATRSLPPCFLSLWR